MTNLTRLRLILVDLSGLMEKKTFETIFFSLRNLNISYKARDAQNVCAVTKGGTVLKIVWCASSIIFMRQFKSNSTVFSLWIVGILQSDHSNEDLMKLIQVL